MSDSETGQFVQHKDHSSALLNKTRSCTHSPPIRSANVTDMIVCSRLEKLVALLLVVSVANVVMLSTVLVGFRSAQADVAQFKVLGKQAQELLDFPNRVIHGSVPNLLNNLIQSSW